MNQQVSWKVLFGVGVVGAVVLFLIGAGGTLAYVLYGAAGLMVALGIVGYFNKK